MIKKEILEKIKSMLAAAPLVLLLGFFRLLPLDTASGLGALMGRGARFLLRGKDRTARINLALVFPEKSAAERDRIRRGMWAHLGRVLAEYSHLAGGKLMNRMEFEGVENIPGKPALYISGHFGQWELFAAFARAHDVKLTLIYRHLNNPYADRVLAWLRLRHAGALVAKGRRGSVNLLRALKNKDSLAMLVDQKMNEGVDVPFFGIPAKTATAVAELSFRYGLPVMPARLVRTKGAHFRATLFPEITVPRSGDDAADARALLLAINGLLEGWIREHPEQWFWVHRRFPREYYHR